MTVIKNVEKYFDIGPELLHTIVTISQWTSGRTGIRQRGVLLALFCSEFARTGGHDATVCAGH